MHEKRAQRLYLRQQSPAGQPGWRRGSIYTSKAAQTRLLGMLDIIFHHKSYHRKNGHSGQL
ncbi:hypothetical protein Cst_c04020 [Thermoclostridium stercorarium subsp. stercorarium DSM 8532]|uniref:Uncharacterized protein n=1 Tax=Thermoclostridium stercorarium (strain ATCC 35414 / DSM 8532 / NCIMB 11754) TaxID=1121335 RepID=L7VL90_THES1|nr:hypothetical protein Cst_c04020 [Thermoclostridium stercorarium subsp. stercorarium DSM 8532]